MDDRSFRALVQRMMDAQASYFEARKQGLRGSAQLDASKKLEREVRAELKRGDQAQQTLWGEV